MTGQPEGYDDAVKALHANKSLRFRRLEAIECWVTGAQYDGRKSWWDDSVPLWERAPCIVYPVVQIAIQSNTDLVLGEGRFPTFTSKPGEDEDSEENGLAEDASAALDRFIVEHHRLCRFRAHAREAFAAGQGCGTAVGIHGVRQGRPFADLAPAKWATPELGPLGEVLGLEIRYPYIEEYKDERGKWRVRARVYRRVINQERDVTYLPAEADAEGREPNWQENKALTSEHKLGFCPVVWYPFMRGCVPVNEIDGAPIHKDITDEIQGHDIAVSQRHRGALFSEPQVVEIGVVPGYSPTELGRPAMVPATADGRKISTGEARSWAGPGFLEQPSGEQARKKGPGYPWQYSHPDTKVSVLTYPGDALKAQDDNARDLRIKLQESLCVVFLDPENIKFAATTSGKALEAIKQKQIDRCNQFRDDLRDNFLLPSVDMQLRIAQKLGDGLKVPGIRKILPILEKFANGVDQPQSAA